LILYYLAIFLKGEKDMPFQVSPGVNVSEIDLTTVIPAVSTSVGAFAGRFQWGPCEVSTLVGSEVALVDQFFKPDSNTYVDFLTAANFLAYSNALRVVRVVDDTSTTGAINAQEGAKAGTDTGLLIKNQEHFDSGTLSFANTFYAKYPGALGNDLTVELCDDPGGAAAGGWKDWWPNTYFDSAPNTSVYASTRGVSNDEIHVAIIDSPTGTFSGTANGVLELYPFLSKGADVRNSSGDLIHWKTYINNNSKYIRIGNETARTNATYGMTISEIIADGKTYYGDLASDQIDGGKLSIRLQSGSDGAIASADYVRGYEVFSDSDQEDVSLIMAGGGGAPGISDETQRNTVIKKAIDISDTRKDAVTFYSPQQEDSGAASAALKLAAVRDFRMNGTNKNTSYAFMDSGWKYQYDKYNDVYRWVPLNGDIAGLAARTDNQRDAWWSPAGYNRGQIKNLVKVAYNPSKAHRDDLYQKQINPVVTFPGQGTILFGDKTSLTRPSAFDRINVRRLFIVLEKAISTAAKFSLFEFNDAFTRAQFRNMVDPFLRDVKGRRGINEFKVVCDETNNPGSVIDRNEFVGDIYIKPVRSINFIQLNFIAVSTGVEFSEVVGKF